MSAILSIRGLTTEFPTRHGMVRAVDGVDLDIQAGECLGVVGESGSGKSVTFMSVVGLVRPPGRVVEGAVLFDGTDLRSLPAGGMRAIRGRDIAITMQDALTALNPAFTVGTQIVEALRAHDRAFAGPAGYRRARERAVEMLRLTGVPDPARRIEAYPHQLSGGMRQRAMIATALACRPRLLIADEPTTALDVTIQAQVLDLIQEMRTTLGMSVVLITHDLGIVAERCARVAVMYAGQVVETGPTADVIARPAHPYTRGLLASMPRLSHLHEPLTPIAGQVPDPTRLPPGCRFAPRCVWRREDCARPVTLRAPAPDRQARCVLVAA